MKYISKSVKLILLIAFTIAIFFVMKFIVETEHINSAISNIAIGDKKSKLVDLLGKPYSTKRVGSELRMRYGATGIDYWIIIFNDKNRVVEKQHYILE